MKDELHWPETPATNANHAHSTDTGAEQREKRNVRRKQCEKKRNCGIGYKMLGGTELWSELLL